MSSRIAGANRETIETILTEEGFDHFGFAELTRPVSIAFYESWLKKGYQGEMHYLERHLPDKRDPQRLMKNAKTAIVVTLDYVPHPSPAPNWPLKANETVAAYARGHDYHYVIKAKLEKVITRLKALAPDENFACFTDSSPVLERDLAQRAGLGWVGKNTCLLSKTKGSLFFIAEIYSTLSLDVARIETHDHCGTCTRCLDACPTGALVAPRELDARRCISYLTIESRETAEVELREKIGGLLFGCDICQTVCPWNLKVHGKAQIAQLSAASARESLVEDLKFLLLSSNRALERAFHGTPLMRSGGLGLKRNAIVVAANMRVHEVEQDIAALKANEKLGELAVWALEKLKA